MAHEPETLIDDDRWLKLLDHVEAMYDGQPDRDERVAETFAHLHRVITDENERSHRSLNHSNPEET